MITRSLISEWIDAMTRTGAKPSTVKHAFFIVRMVLAQAVVDGLLTVSPAEHVRVRASARPTAARPA